MSDRTTYEVHRGGRWVEVDQDTWRSWNGARRATRITGQASSTRADAVDARQQLKNSGDGAGNWVLATNASAEAARIDVDADPDEPPDGSSSS